MLFCAEDGCIDIATRKGLCAGHLKQLQRNGSTTKKYQGKGARYKTKFERVVAAAIRLVDCDSEDDAAWNREIASFTEATTAWVRSRGWAKCPGDCPHK